MGKSIVKVEMPADVTSGTAFDVAVDYTSAGGGTMTITYSGSFEGSPSQVTLPASKTQKTFEMTLTRVSGPPPLACRVVLAFGNDVTKLPRVS